MKRIVLTLLTLSIGFTAVAQKNGWKWPEDPAERAKATEIYTLFSDYYRTGKYQAARPYLDQLLEKYPDLHLAIYKNGITVYKDEWKNTKEATEKAANAQKVLDLYKKRFELYPNDKSKNIDRMALDAFQFYYLDKTKTPLMLDLFEEAYSLKGVKTNYACANYYMKSVKLGKTRGIEFTDDEVLGIYDTVMKSLNAYIAGAQKSGKSTDRYERIKEQADKALADLGVINCDFIVEKLVPQFEENPSDAELANKIFTFAFDGQCTDEEWFLNAAIVVFKNTPNFGLAQLIASRYAKEGEIETAKDYYQQAAELADDNINKGKALRQLASLQRKGGNKAEAKRYAIQAVDADPTLKEDMYTLIGSMILESDECNQLESIVEDKARFIAAYDWFQKAGNTLKMKASEAYFPTIGDIFTEGKAEGQSVKVGCWIQQTVKLRKKPNNE